MFDRHRPTTPLDWSRRDWLIAAGLTGLAALARIADLGTGPPGLAIDEGGVFAITLEVLNTNQRPAFKVDHLALTGIFHYISGFCVTYLGWLGLDTVQTAKLPNALFGALAVTTLYVTVPVLRRASRGDDGGAVHGVRRAAEWIASRLNYQYAGDMFWIGATTALVVLGYRTNRLSLLAAAGWTAAAGVAWFKAALFGAPWAALLAADYALLPPRGGRQHVAAGAGRCWCAAGLPRPDRDAVPPRSGHLPARQQRRPRARRPIGGTGHVARRGHRRGAFGAFFLLQVSQGHAGRYGVRWNHAALDPLASALFTIGICYCVWRCRERGARIALAGLLVFLLPASASYPQEVGGVLTVARRMTPAAACSWPGWRLSAPWPSPSGSSPVRPLSGGIHAHPRQRRTGVQPRRHPHLLLWSAHRL